MGEKGEGLWKGLESHLICGHTPVDVYGFSTSGPVFLVLLFVTSFHGTTLFVRCVCRGGDVLH